MGLFSNLAKGFITSAVNQVGRDGGKVISNRVYGNSHSTPIRISPSNDNSNLNTLNKDKDKNEINRINTRWDILKYIGVGLFAISSPYFGLPLSIFLGYKNSKKTTVTIYKNENKAVYVNDKRYKDGLRFEGFRNITVPIKTNANSIEIEYLKSKSKKYYIISLLTASVWCLIILSVLISK